MGGGNAADPEPGADAHAAPAPASAGVGPFPDGVAVTTLDSGLRVATERMAGVRSAAIGFWVGVGSRQEDPTVVGAAHFLEHLLFKGTPRRDAAQIAAELDSVGGDLNAFTTKETTCYMARCLDRDVPRAVDVLADMVGASLLRSQDVEAERTVVIEEWRQHEDAPDDLAHSAFAEACFGTHPLGREVLGTRESVESMSRDALAGMYHSSYRPERVVVSVAGNVAHDDVVEWVAEATRTWPLEHPEQPLRGGNGDSPQPSSDPRIRLRPRPTEQAHLVIGRPGLHANDPRRFAGRVLDEVLGGGPSSRLFQEIREKRGLAYGVGTALELLSDAGEFGAWVGTAPQSLPQVIDVVREELARALRTGVTEEELDRARGGLAGQTVLALEDTGSRMVRLGKSLTLGTPLLSLDELVSSVESVTRDEVGAAAEALLDGPLAVAVAGSFDEDAVTGAAEPLR